MSRVAERFMRNLFSAVFSGAKKTLCLFDVERSEQNKSVLSAMRFVRWIYSTRLGSRRGHKGKFSHSGVNKKNRRGESAAVVGENSVTAGESSRIELE